MRKQKVLLNKEADTTIAHLYLNVNSKKPQIEPFCTHFSISIMHLFLVSNLEIWQNLRNQSGMKVINWGIHACKTNIRDWNKIWFSGRFPVQSSLMQSSGFSTYKLPIMMYDYITLWVCLLFTPGLQFVSCIFLDTIPRCMVSLSIVIIPRCMVFSEYCGKT